MADDNIAAGNDDSRQFVSHSDPDLSEHEQDPEPLVEEFQQLFVAHSSSNSAEEVEEERHSPSPPLSYSPESPSQDRKRSNSSAPVTPASAARNNTNNLALISTPMMEGHKSPCYSSTTPSQVSTGSVPPTNDMVAYLLAELTPVTRNTTSAFAACTSGGGGGGGGGATHFLHRKSIHSKNMSSEHMTTPISPDETLLFGEDLALPSHDVDHEWYPKIRPGGGGGTSGVLLQHHQHHQYRHLHHRPANNAHMKAKSQEEEAGDDQFENNNSSLLLPPIPFERKYYSFTSRDQYQDSVLGSRVEDEASIPPPPPPPRLTPYQPNDRELLGDLGLREDYLNDIFIARRRVGSSTTNAQANTANNAHRSANASVFVVSSSTDDVVDSSKQHRLSLLNLNSPIPMNERQTSIPSIRMANHLNGSVTSNTEEDEDSLYHLHDEEDEEEYDIESSCRFGGSGNVVYFGAPDGEDDHDGGEHHDVVDRTTTPPKCAAKAILERRKRGRREEAMEWLQSVVEVSDHSNLAEAASSKFLTRHDYHQPYLLQQHHVHHSHLHHHIPRRDSSPPGFLATLPR